jgi:CheY-like chemotaxis protein/anti-sigma regulatory factor (Ser/Thr protein kinase)
MQMEERSEQDREYSDAIIKAGNHLLDLINDVLEIARIETGKLALSIEPIHVGELLYDALDLVRPLARPRHISLRTEMRAGAETYARADRQRLKQVLVNLIANAIKYNRENGDVVVTVTETQTAERRLRLEVTDTGAGIAPESMGKLFTPFERLDAALTGVEGTGLGLALSKSLTEAMGGNIGVESIMGAGSTFWVELASAEAPTVRLDEHDREALPAGPQYAAGHTVLYIEDTASNVQLISRTLSLRPEVTLVTATHGEKAVELARFHQPGLVLLDMHLPDIDGEAVLERLKADPDTRHIPVVAISADAARPRINRVMQHGAYDYLTKPVNVKRFLETVDRLLGEKALAGTAAEAR